VEVCSPGEAVCTLEEAVCTLEEAVCVLAAVCTLEEAGDGEGAVCSHCKQFCDPIRGRGHSNCRKQPWRMNGHPNRNILSAIISLKAWHR
jgi:hypothetical protein